MLIMTKTNDLYEYPEYYDMALCSFRDICKDIYVIEECIRRFSKIEVDKVLELACGPSPYTGELVKRGYQYIGIDNKKTMIDYCNKKYNSIANSAEFMIGDMNNLPSESTLQNIDLIFIMGGSLFPKNEEDIIRHFKSAARLLKSGGIYILDSCIATDSKKEQKHEYKLEFEKVVLNVEMNFRIINPIKQILNASLIVDVQEGSRNFCLKAEDIFRIIYPREFRDIINSIKEFEFCGWWNDWDFGKPLDLEKEIGRILTVIRRT